MYCLEKETIFGLVDFFDLKNNLSGNLNNF
jgi:hypothetical protein